MKTAISISNSLFVAAEHFAKQLHLSRSALYSLALAEFIKSYQSNNITEKLNAVYQNEAQDLDPSLMAAQAEILAQEKW